MSKLVKFVQIPASYELGIFLFNDKSHLTFSKGIYFLHTESKIILPDMALSMIKKRSTLGSRPVQHKQIQATDNQPFHWTCKIVHSGLKCDKEGGGAFRV